MRFSACVLGLVVIAPQVVAQGKVIVVDATGAGAFTDLRAAVDAANDGDLVLVKDGLYDTFRIEGKSLTVTADLGANVEMLNWMPAEVFTLAPGQRVVVRGLRSTGITGTAGTLGGFRTSFNEGLVWYEDIESCGENSVNPSVLAPLASGTVIYQRATMTGECPTSIPGAGRSGLSVFGSKVFAFDSKFTAGNLAGLSGVHASFPAEVFLSNVDAAGGSGFTGVTAICLDGSQGGHGLELNGVGASAVVVSSTFAPGAGGLAGGGCSGPGPDGDSISIYGGSLTDLGGTFPPRTLEATSPVRAGTSTTLTATGVAGDLIFVLYSTEPAAMLATQFRGAFLTDAPLVTTLGTIPGFPANPELVQAVPLPPLDPGLEFVEVFAQVAVLDGLGNPWLGSGSVIDVLSPIF